MIKKTRATEAAVIGALAALCVVALTLDALLMRAMVQRYHMNDFGKFYYSARAFLDGGDMYAPSPATTQGPDDPSGLEYLNLNPPHFHLLVLPFAPLRPETAVMSWMIVSLFALIVSILIITRETAVAWTATRVLLLTLGVLAFAGTQAFFLTGQLSMLLLLAMTVCWLQARRGNWTAAAVGLGLCLSVKPFLLLFIPYLIATRRSRAAAIAVGTAAACFAVGLLVFGLESYSAWYRALGEAGDWTWAEMNASTLGIFRRSFDVQPIGVTPVMVRPALVTLWMPVAAAIGVVTLVATIGDRSESSVDRAFALLLVAAPLMSPLGWIYYFGIGAGPVAALVFGPRRQHVRSWSSILVAAIAGVGLFWPHPLLGAFQPHRWATLFVTSAYFWGALAAWTWLVLDARHAIAR